jgi:hypothetical protein
MPLIFSLICTILAGFLCLVQDAFSAEVTMSWDPPTTNTDGTPLTDLAGYKVYFGITSQNYSHTMDVGNVTVYTVGNLTEGLVYYFAVTAYDTSGNESEYSNEASKTIQFTIQFTQQYTLTVNKGGTGSGAVTSSLSGINCGSDCSAMYDAGTSVTLAATPDTSSAFTGWSGSGCAGAGTCTVTLDAAKKDSNSYIYSKNLYGNDNSMHWWKHLTIWFCFTESWCKSDIHHNAEYILQCEICTGRWEFNRSC